MVAFLLALLATLIVGLSLFFLLTAPLEVPERRGEGFERGSWRRRVEVHGSDELGALGRSFNQMASTIEADVEKLRLAERMRRDLIGNISHDLRSPLASHPGIPGNHGDEGRRSSPPRSGARFLEISLRNAGEPPEASWRSFSSWQSWTRGRSR